MKQLQQSLIRPAGFSKVAPGVWRMKILFVNIYMIEDRTTHNWALVDAGIKGFTSRILRMARELFGSRPPSCIVMTHGHFDHRGCLESLLKVWNVPVYIHAMELPYLTGISSYPPPDPLVGGGMMAYSSMLYPREPIDIGQNARKISGNLLPELPDWRIIDTPGHTPGHISLFREADRVLIAGDAFVTTKQESVFYALSQKRHLSGPPKYFTPDWEAAEASVHRLAALHPRTAATGHGKPMYGNELQTKLSYLAEHFREKAVPKKGRYVNQPAEADESGTTYTPKRPVRQTVVTAGLVIAVLGALAGSILFRRRFQTS
jgi:glyoxylase-like metal-dependent hydrolase (beta-lactamase superfamily II)